MKMANMKMPKETTKELKEMHMPKSPEDNGDRWPDGLKLRFEEDEIEKLPQLEKVKIGEKIKIEAIGEAVEIRKNERKEGKAQFTIEIQIQQIGCSSKEDYDESFKEASEGA